MADTNPDLDEVELGNGDIDYSTEEGRARLDRRHAFYQRKIRRLMEKYEAERRSKIPAVAVTFEIPEALYVKGPDSERPADRRRARPPPQPRRPHRPRPRRAGRVDHRGGLPCDAVAST